MRPILFILIVSTFIFCATSKSEPKKTLNEVNKKEIRTGAEQTEKYLRLLKGKRVALMANQTKAGAISGIMAKIFELTFATTARKLLT